MTLTLRRLWSIYRSCSLGDRLHVMGRAVLCPMARVASYAPRSGRVLDIGCGHGVLAAHIVEGTDQESVLGVDLSAAKIKAACRATLPADRVEFRCAPYEAVDERFDAIFVVDVLYLMPQEAHVAMFRWCHEHLSDSGVLVVKEVGDRPRWKYWLSYWQEVLAVRVLRLTLGDRPVFASPSATAARLTSAGFEVTQVPLGAGYAHAHLLFLCRRREAR